MASAHKNLMTTDRPSYPPALRHRVRVGVMAFVTINGLVLSMFFLSLSIAYAETDTPVLDVSAAKVPEFGPEFYVVVGFCLLGLIVIALQAVLFLRSKENIVADEIIRAFSISLILIAVVALLGIGYSDKQVQPAIALFGTLMGYLMGQGETRRRTKIRRSRTPLDTAPPREKPGD